MSLLRNLFLYPLIPMLFFPQITCGGELVLDDFTDPAKVSSPSMADEFVITENVGELHARRSIAILVTSSNVPNGSLDIGTERDSTLSLELNGVPRLNPLTPIIEYSLGYDFSPVDAVTESGNNAVLVDFDSFTGNDLPLFMRAFVQETTNPAVVFEGRTDALFFSPTAFTIALPFSVFTTRGNGVGNPDFSTLRNVQLTFFDLGDLEDAQWNAEVSRVRFGRLPVPEPGGLTVVSSLVAIILTCRVRVPTRFA